AVLAEKAVALALVADTVADDEVVGAVDGQPAVVAVPDGGADHRAAAHAVADKMEMETVAAEYAFLAQVAELGIADGAGRLAMVHRMAARTVRCGLDHDVATQVGHLAAINAVAFVVVGQRPIQNQFGPINGPDESLFRLGVIARAAAVGP